MIDIIFLIKIDHLRQSHILFKNLGGGFTTDLRKSFALITLAAALMNSDTSDTVCEELKSNRNQTVGNAAVK